MEDVKALGASRPALGPSDLRSVLGLVRLAYEGPGDEDAWRAFLRQLRELLRAEDAFLVRFPLEPGVPPLTLAENVDPSLLERYRGTWIASLRNPVLAAARKARWRGSVIGDQIVPLSEQMRTEFWNEVRRPRGVKWEIGAADLSRPDALQWLAANRRPGHRRFSEREVGILDGLYPHVMRALELDARAEAERRARRTLSAALDAVDDALLAIDAGGAVRPVNLAGERFLRRESVSALEPLLAEVRRFREALGDAVHAIRPALPDRDVTAPSGRAYRVTARPDFEAGLLGAIVLTLRQRRDPSTEGADDAAGALGLTPRERDVLRLLVRGRSSPEICRDLAISNETLRVHVRHLFEKSGARSRLELLASVRMGGSP